MRTRAGVAFALLLVGCPEAPAKAPPPPPPVDTAPVPDVSTAAPPPSASAKPAAPKPGTKTTLAERKNDDTWDRMLLAGGRLFALTDVNRWTTGPMYVPAARLWSVPVDGGELTKHMDLEGLATLAADDTSLYVAVQRDLSTMNGPKAKSPTGRIFKMPLAGGAPKDLATAIEPHLVALDGDTLWFDGYRMPKDGSKSPALSGVKNPMTFAFDDENVYYTVAKSSGEKGGRLLRMPKKGGPTTVLASGLPDEPGGLAVDATHVYVSATTWTSPAAERAGIVGRVPKAGGDLEVLAKDQPSVRAIWLSGDHVYVVSGRGGRPGNVLRLPKTGGDKVETVASDTTLRHATGDATSIYYASDGTFREEPFQRLSPAVLVRIVK